MRASFALLLLLCLPASAAAQTADDLLRQMKALGEQAAKLLPPTPLPPTGLTVVVPAGGSIQAAVNGAAPGTHVLIKAGVTYNGSFIIPVTNPGVTVETENCPIGDRGTLPTDSPALGKIQLTTGQSYGAWVMASNTTIRCVEFLPNPACSGEMVRVGDQGSANLADVPDKVSVAQNYFHGSPGAACGQKRGVLAGGSHTVVDRNWFEDIWALKQDSQCVAVLSTPGPVAITRNIGACASENFIIGGVPPASAAFIPSDVEVAWNIWWKPAKWRTLVDHQVKNDGEAKIGHRLNIHHNLFDGDWPQAQSGVGVLLTMATNGACSWCDMREVTFAYNIVQNVAACLSITGYQYQYAPGAGQATGFLVHDNLCRASSANNPPAAAGQSAGSGRFLTMENEPAGVVLHHNTIVQDGSSVVYGSYGTKWPFQDPPLLGSVAAGPVKGFQFTDNVVATFPKYGLMTPEGNSGVGLATYFPGAVVGGNVWAGAAAATMARYDAFAGAFGPNVAGAVTLDANGCQAAFAGKGADCAQLPLALLAQLPK